MDGSSFDRFSTSLSTASSRREIFKRFVWGLVVVPFLGRVSMASNVSRTFHCKAVDPTFPCASGFCCQNAIGGGLICAGGSGYCCNAPGFNTFACINGFKCGSGGCVK